MNTRAGANRARVQRAKGIRAEYSERIRMSRQCPLGAQVQRLHNHSSRAEGWAAVRIERLERTLAILEVRRLTVRRPATRDPVGDPVDHLLHAYARVTEESMAELAVTEQGIGRFRIGEFRGCTEQTGKFLSDAA